MSQIIPVSLSIPEGSPEMKTGAAWAVYRYLPEGVFSQWKQRCGSGDGSFSP